ncbi:hypothetical protein B0T22DRAFT_171544 [Podospora appendiculata]|uniref:Cerato-platanin n=1 Tax=Podospora appendiculata TaxID=314037 RepID=A0AAE1CD72_9PEZI|nr:hypothetical protein B0T22DRAFT_171544 [Podospora appendiculata]
MRRSAKSFLSFSLSLIAAPLAMADSGTVWVTPHESYSSSVGVLGCKVNTDRIAYWPSAVDCTNICVSLTYSGRTVHLLKVDQSAGAHDVSYDAWNYLYTGFPATEKPAAGGATAMEYQDVDVSVCADLIHTDDGKLPLSASNSMNYLASCLGQKDSWVGRNYALYNIMDPLCAWGYDEGCTLDWPAANQGTCPHVLGTPEALNSPVYNIRYPTGDKVLASSGQTVATGGAGASSAGSAGHPAAKWSVGMAMAYGMLTCWLLPWN